AQELGFHNMLNMRSGLQELRSNCCNALCPELAQSGHRTVEFRCLLLGVKRTLSGHALMSAFDPKGTLAPCFCSHSRAQSEEAEQGTLLPAISFARWERRAA